MIKLTCSDSALFLGHFTSLSSPPDFPCDSLFKPRVCSVDVPERAVHVLPHSPPQPHGSSWGHTHKLLIN